MEPQRGRKRRREVSWEKGTGIERGRGNEEEETGAGKSLDRSLLEHSFSRGQERESSRL